MESHLQLLLVGVWASLTLLTFAVVDMSSVGGWFTLVAVFGIPPILLLRLMNDGPPQIVAEVIRSTEDGR